MTLSRAPVSATAALLMLASAALAGCSAQARSESCAEKADELRAQQSDGVLDPAEIRELRSQGCLNVSPYG